jgi:hypothetical protein
MLLISACNRAPDHAETLIVLRRANPALDSATAVERVWADGPPWFSCAEVIGKLRGTTDRAVVRDQLANWRTLVLADWITLRDTNLGPVTEPGWCRARLHDDTTRLSAGWQTVRGELLPTGEPRLGWDVVVGRQRLVVRMASRLIGKDSASAAYLSTVAPNANGIALGADKDSVPRRALLVRQSGEWRAAQLDWRGDSTSRLGR